MPKSARAPFTHGRLGRLLRRGGGGNDDQQPAASCSNGLPPTAADDSPPYAVRVRRRDCDAVQVENNGCARACQVGHTDSQTPVHLSWHHLGRRWCTQVHGASTAAYRRRVTDAGLPSSAAQTGATLRRSLAVVRHGAVARPSQCSCTLESHRSRCSPAGNERRRSYASSRSVTVQSANVELSSADAVGQFVKSTTFHGFNQIITTRSWWARAFWLSIICLVFIFVFLQLRSLIVQFIDNPTLTNIKLKYPPEGMQLPPLTICMLSKLNHTAVREKYPDVNMTLAELSLTSFISAYSTALMDMQYFERQGYDVVELLGELNAAIGGGDQDNFVHYLNNSSFSCRGQFLACWFENAHLFDCCTSTGREAFAVRKFLAHSGTCFEFEPHPQRSHQLLPGPVGGLGFVYWYPNDHILKTAYNGYDEHAIHLYMSATDALLEKNPIALPVGYHTHISLQATKTVQQKRDELGRATCLTPQLKYFSNYSFGACQVECLIDQMLHTCNCTGVATYITHASVHVCDPAEAIACFKKLAAKFPSLLSDCRMTQCSEACEYWLYRPSLTVGKVFNPNIVDKMMAYWRLPEGNPELSLIIGDVYFEEIQYTELTQLSAFTVETFVSSIGGCMGLWTGASIITWVHLMYWCCWYWCGKRKKRAWTASTTSVNADVYRWSVPVPTTAHANANHTHTQTNRSCGCCPTRATVRRQKKRKKRTTEECPADYRQVEFNEHAPALHWRDEVDL